MFLEKRDYYHLFVAYNPAMLMTATIERLPEAMAVVTLSGPLTLGTSLKFADSQVQGAISDGVTKLIFDLTAVDFVDSAGLGMIVYVYGAINEKNGTLRLCGVAPRIRPGRLTAYRHFLSSNGRPPAHNAEGIAGNPLKLSL